MGYIKNTTNEKNDNTKYNFIKNENDKVTNRIDINAENIMSFI